MDKICAGIVTYNPDIRRLEENIISIKHQVEKIFVYDNSSKNIEDIKAIVEKDNNSLIQSNSNDGIATAFNKIISIAENEGFSWVLTLDQDSVCPQDMIKIYMKNINDYSAIICPIPIDKRRIDIDYIIPNEKISYVEYAITSGSLVNIKICKKIGGFDDFLFIGYVDKDFCKRVISSGYKIVRCNDVILDQEFGSFIYNKYADRLISFSKKYHIEIIKKFSYQREISPLRVKYAIRNQIYLNKKYKTKSNIMIDVYKNIITIFRAQKKFETIKAMINGMVEGFRSNPTTWSPNEELQRFD